MVIATSAPAPQGHCSQCGKIWTLNERQGVCQWCGKQSTCQSPTAKPRHMKSRSNGRKRQANGNGYDQLDCDWLYHYKVATAYENKIPLQDREDYRHDVMIELDRATKRDGKPLPELRAYRIASLTVALYYRKLNRFSTRVCVFNGYPTDPHCKGCQNMTKAKRRCAWLAVRPVASLDGEIIDHDGYKARLLDTVATDKALDLPDKWYEVNEVRQGLPLRLVEIGYKRLNKIPLTKYEQLYLCRLWKRQQKRLIG